MRKIFAISMVAAMSATVPALAQSAGYFGAPSGHNTPGGGVDTNRGYPGYGNNGFDRDRSGYGDARNGANGYEYGFGGGFNQGGNGFDPDYNRVPGANSYGVSNPSGAIEGRAAADDVAPSRKMPARRHKASEGNMEMSR